MEKNSSVQITAIFPALIQSFDKLTAKKKCCTSRLQANVEEQNFSSLPHVPYLLVVKGIVNGVTQSRDKIWLRYQQHALLDQKLCLDKQQTEKTVKNRDRSRKQE